MAYDYLGCWYISPSNAEDMFNQTTRELNRSKGRIKPMYNHKLTTNDLLDKNEMQAKDCIIRRADGVEVTIPSSWFTKTGKIRKSKLQEYRELLGA